MRLGVKHRQTAEPAQEYQNQRLKRNHAILNSSTCVHNILSRKITRGTKMILPKDVWYMCGHRLMGPSQMMQITCLERLPATFESLIP